MSLKLSLRVVEADDLAYLTSEHEAFPYCLIQVSNTSQIKRTAVREKTISPVWDEEFSFIVRHKTDSLKIFVKDCSKGESHNVLSTVALRLKDYHSGSTIDQWFALTPVKGVKTGGKIHLKFRLDPINRLRLPALSPKRNSEPHIVFETPEPVPIQDVIPEPIQIEEPPIVTSRPPSRAQRSSIIIVSAEFGDIVDTEDPNSVKSIDNPFASIAESPAKMYTADAMTTLMLEMSKPVFGPYWALAKISSFITHQACDYFTNFAVVGCDQSSKDFTRAMKQFFDMSNHDINRNRINFCKDPKIGPLMTATFNAYDTAIAAMARKKTLIAAREAINEAMDIVDSISVDPLHRDGFEKALEALTRGCSSYTEREDGVFYRNLGGAALDGLGLNAAVVAFGLSSLEHAMNCYICNSFGTRIIVEKIIRPVTAPERKIVLPSFGKNKPLPLLTRF